MPARIRLSLYLLVFACVAAYLSFVPASAGVVDAQTPVLWTAGYESGNLAEWEAAAGGQIFATGSGTAGVTTDYARSGQRSAKLSISNATGTNQGIQFYRWAEIQGRNETYVSSWFYLPQQYSGMSWWNLMQWQSRLTADSVPLWVLNVGNRPDGSMYLYLTDQVRGKGYGQTKANLPVGRWFHVEAYYKQAADRTGQLTIWQDGKQILDVSRIITRRAGDTIQWAVGNFTDRISPSDATLYIDDAAMSTVLLGPGSGSAPTPTAPVPTAPAATGTPVPTSTLTVPTATAVPTTAPTSTAVVKPAANAPLHTFADAFADNTIDSALWRVGGYSGDGSAAVSVLETNGQLQVAPAVNLAGYSGYTSQSSYDLTGSSIQVQVVQATGPKSTAETLLQLSLDGANKIEMLASGTVLKARAQLAGATATVATTSYGPSTQWWRIRHDVATDTVYWDVSPDGASWSNMASRKRDFAVTGLKVSLQAGTWGADASPGKAVFDNVNATGGAPAPTPAATATPVPSDTGSMPAPAGYSTLVFQDRFSGTSLDSTKWIPEIADQYGVWRNNGKLPAPLSAVGNAGNFNAEYGNPIEVIVNDGLTLGAHPDTSQAGYSWRAGYITTHGKFYFTGGYFQVKAKMPDSRTGGWGGLWFLEGGGEIDLHEAGYTGLGADKVNQVIASNLHTSGNSQKLYDTGVDLSADYHVYGMDYRPGQSITMYFDGKQIAQYTTNIPTGGYTIIITNTLAQNAEGWHTVVGPTTPSSLPMSVAEVQVWK